MQEDRPFLPWVIERAFQLLNIGQNPETALRIGVGEGVGLLRHRSWPFRRRSSREIEESFGRLLRQLVDDVEQRILVYPPHRIEPLSLSRLNGAEQKAVKTDARKQQRLHRCRRGHRPGDGRNLDPLGQLDELRRASHRMPLDPSAARPIHRRRRDAQHSRA